MKNLKVTLKIHIHNRVLLVRISSDYSFRTSAFSKESLLES